MWFASNALQPCDPGIILVGQIRLRKCVWWLVLNFLLVSHLPPNLLGRSGTLLPCKQDFMRNTVSLNGEPLIANWGVVGANAKPKIQVSKPDMRKLRAGAGGNPVPCLVADTLASLLIAKGKPCARNKTFAAAPTFRVQSLGWPCAIVIVLRARGVILSSQRIAKLLFDNAMPRNPSSCLLHSGRCARIRVNAYLQSSSQPVLQSGVGLRDGRECGERRGLQGKVKSKRVLRGYDLGGSDHQEPFVSAFRLVQVGGRGRCFFPIILQYHMPLSVGRIVGRAASFWQVVYEKTCGHSKESPRAGVATEEAKAARLNGKIKNLILAAIRLLRSPQECQPVRVLERVFVGRATRFSACI